MSLRTKNIQFLKIFIRNLSDIGRTSRAAAARLQEEIESTVRRRVAEGEFRSGLWQNKPYSRNPIKAHKLGNAVVSSVGFGGLEQQMTIDGQIIPENEWYWGDSDRKSKGFGEPRGRINSTDYHPRPTPVFEPGYAGWRRKQGKGLGVNLKFSGSMLGSFNIKKYRGRGSNQYGSNWRFTFEVGNSRKEKYTNRFREWKYISHRELDKAIDRSGADISSMLMGKLTF